MPFAPGFRSQDRGASWESIRTFGPAATRFQLQLAPSPRFADEHIVLSAITDFGPTPNSTHCTIESSDDAGSTWTEKVGPSSYEVCSFLQLFGGQTGFEAMVLKGGTRLWSPDSGRTWGYASSPTSFEPIVPSPSYVRSGTLFAGGASGVWAIGNTVLPTYGMLPCAVPTVLGFGRVWSGHVEVQEALGCATQPERSITIRQREYVNQYCGPTRVLWPDDSTINVFHELYSSCPSFNLQRFNKSEFESRVPRGPEQVMQGAVQVFEGGIMLFLPRSDVERTIVVLPDTGDWREFLD